MREADHIIDILAQLAKISTRVQSLVVFEYNEFHSGYLHAVADIELARQRLEKRLHELERGEEQ